MPEKKEKKTKPAKRKTLTPRQEQFVLNLVAGMTQKDAYVSANYSASTDEIASVKASALFSQPHIKKRYDDLISRAEEKAVDALGIKKEDIVKALKEIADGDLTEFIKFDKHGHVKYTSSNSKKINGKLVKRMTLNKNDSLQLELYDRMAALVEIAKLLGFYKTEEGPVGGTIKVELIDDDDE